MEKEVLDSALRELVDLGHVEMSVRDDGEFVFWLTPAGVEAARKVLGLEEEK